MPLDGIASHFLAAELDTALRGARLDRIQQITRYELIFQFRSPGKTQDLQISANPSSAAIHLSGKRQSPNGHPVPQRFCMYLRKHLGGSKLLSVRNQAYERVLEFDFSAYDEMGDRTSLTLICELMGRHSNLILVNERRQILDALIHVDSAMNRVREILPAHPYQPAPPQNKLLPSEALAKLADPDVGSTAFWSVLPFHQPLAKALMSRLAGFSPQLSDAVCDSAGIDPRSRCETLSAAQWQLLKTALHDYLAATVELKAHAAIYVDPGDPGHVLDFHALPLHIGRSREFPDLSAALTEYHRLKEERNRVTQKREALRRKICEAIKYWEKKLQIHERDLAASQGYQTDKENGDLLISYLHLVPASASQVVVEDFFNDMRPRTIPLNPALNPGRNAQAYYKKYNKLKNKQMMAQRFIHREREELDYLESLLVALENADSSGDLALVLDELGRYQKDQRHDLFTDLMGEDRHDDKSGNPAKNPHRQIRAKGSSFAERKAARIRSAGDRKGRHAAAADRTLGPRRYVGSEGHVLLVGRNNLQNDKLSLKQADKNDLWFHVQKAPGSHLILQCAHSSAQPSPKAIAEAAAIAAWFSRYGQHANVAGAGGAIDVDYCPAGHLKKPRGAKPGMVIYEGYETMRVHPLDPSNLQAADESVNGTS